MQQSPPPQNQPNSHVLALTYRVQAMEQEVRSIKAQINGVVTQRENELQLRPIRDTVERIEKKLADMEKASNEQREALEKRITEQGNSQDKLQIRVLWGIVSTGIVILTSVLVAFLTHHIV